MGQRGEGRLGSAGDSGQGPPARLAPYLRGHARPTAAPWAGCWGWGSGRRGQRAGAPGSHGMRPPAPSRWPQSCPRRPRLQREGGRQAASRPPPPSPPPRIPRLRPAPPQRLGLKDQPGSTQKDSGLEKETPGASRAPSTLGRRALSSPYPRGCGSPHLQLKVGAGERVWEQGPPGDTE